MEVLLADLENAAKAVLSKLRGEYSDQLFAALHNHNKDHLPDKELGRRASSLVNTLHDLQLVLEPAQLILADHFLGYVGSKCLVAATDLGIPDALDGGKQVKVADLAQVCNANPIQLRQILRMLSSKGIFAYDPLADSASQNHVSKLLVASHWMGWRNWVDVYANIFYDMATKIPDACIVGEDRSPGQIHVGTHSPITTYFKEQGMLPKFYKTFNSAAIAQAPGLLADYPWQDICNDKIIDVGGGDGGFIATILRAFPNMHGGVLELPNVIEMARSNFSKGGSFDDVRERVADADLIGGDFFKAVPENDIYMIKWCLHNWKDEDAVQILETVRMSMRRTEKSRLILFECLLEDGHSARLARYGDMNMFITLKGQERSIKEWENLATLSRWKISRVFNLRDAWPVAIELVPDWKSDSVIKDDLVESVSTAAGEVAVNMTFLEPWDEIKGNPYFRSAPDPGFDQTNFKWTDHNVIVRDARPRKQNFSLDANGFAYVDDPDGGLTDTLVEALSSNENSVVTQEYYPRVKRLIQSRTNAERVIVFDHTVRRRRPELASRSNENGQEQPATIVHCDQSEKGAIRRVKQNLGQEEDVDAILKKRIQLLNVWRPLNGAVVDWPLAQMDFSTIKPADVHPCDLWRHQFQENGQTVTCTYNPEQEWHYLSNHRMDEVTMIKIWDSFSDAPATMCAHAAFKHPRTPAGAEPRESIEVRCIVIYGD